MVKAKLRTKPPLPPPPPNAVFSSRLSCKAAMNKYLAYAEACLRQAQCPLSVSDMWSSPSFAAHRKHLEPYGKTPWSSLGAALYLDIKNNPQSPFCRPDKGLFALKEFTLKEKAKAPLPQPIQTAQDAFRDAELQANEELKKTLRSVISNMTPSAFEELINRLIVKMGFGCRHETTPSSHDGGIDGIVYGDALGLNVVFVQSKHYNPRYNVQNPEIQQFIGALCGRDGVFVTSSDFSPKARATAANPGTSVRIALINGEDLIAYLIKYGIGIQTRHVYTLREIDTAFYEELNDAY